MEKGYNSIMKQKLKFFDILKQALTLPGKNINFIIFYIFASLPFFCFLVFFEIVLQRALLEASKFFIQPLFKFYSYDILSQYGTLTKFYYYYDDNLWQYGTLTKDLCFKLFPVFLLYLARYQLLEFLNLIIIVPIAAIVYSEKKQVIGFVDTMVCKRKLIGPFITSIFVHLLSITIPLGLVVLAINLCLMVKSFQTYDCFHIPLTLFRGVGFTVLLMKFLEWSAGWNMALVASILEEKYGIEALEFSAYISKNSSKRGLYLMLVFFVWGLIIRLPSIFYWFNEDLIGGILFTSLLTCLIYIGIVMKWAVCVVCFFDCKKQILAEKEADENWKELLKLDNVFVLPGFCNSYSYS